MSTTTTTTKNMLCVELITFHMLCMSQCQGGPFLFLLRYVTLHAFEVTCTGFLWPGVVEEGHVCPHRGGVFQSLPGHRLLSAHPPLLLLLITLLLPLLLLNNRYCSSSPVPPGSMKKAPSCTAPPPRHDGPQAIHCVDVLILRYFSYQIWIMHLIFLATLLVSILSPWLHPSLASSGMYCKLARWLF